MKTSILRVGLFSGIGAIAGTLAALTYFHDPLLWWIAPFIGGALGCFLEGPREIISALQSAWKQALESTSRQSPEMLKVRLAVAMQMASYCSLGVCAGVLGFFLSKYDIANVGPFSHRTIELQTYKDLSAPFFNHAVLFVAIYLLTWLSVMAFVWTRYSDTTIQKKAVKLSRTTCIRIFWLENPIALIPLGIVTLTLALVWAPTVAAALFAVFTVCALFFVVAGLAATIRDAVRNSRGFLAVATREASRHIANNMRSSIFLGGALGTIFGYFTGSLFLGFLVGSTAGMAGYAAAKYINLRLAPQTASTRAT